MWSLWPWRRTAIGDLKLWRQIYCLLQHIQQATVSYYNLVDRGGCLLYAKPASAVPHCASPLTLSQIPVKRQCYYKQLRTCHIDSPFCDTLAADRRITTKVLAFLLVLKLSLWCWYILPFNFNVLYYTWQTLSYVLSCSLSAPVTELP